MPTKWCRRWRRDTIREAAERARELSFAEQMRAALASGGQRAAGQSRRLAVRAGRCCSPGVGTFALFLLVNALLLGRELQDMVWLRHLPASAGAAARRSAGENVFCWAALLQRMLAVPFANFLAPVLGAASATHLVHRKSRQKQLSRKPPLMRLIAALLLAATFSACAASPAQQAPPPPPHHGGPARGAADRCPAARRQRQGSARRRSWKGRALAASSASPPPRWSARFGQPRLDTPEGDMRKLQFSGRSLRAGYLSSIRSPPAPSPWRHGSRRGGRVTGRRWTALACIQALSRALNRRNSSLVTRI